MAMSVKCPNSDCKKGRIRYWCAEKGHVEKICLRCGGTGRIRMDGGSNKSQFRR